MRLVIALLCLFCLPVQATEHLRIAVAANLLPVMERMADRYQRETGITLQLAGGSTGAFYEQIRRGAPFDLFYAADAERPALLTEAGIGQPARPYACGRLALWTPGHAPDLHQLPPGRIAIAQPDTAPYGRAAQQALQHAGRWAAEQPDVVYGQDIGQAFQFVASGNAVAGLVALSQLRAAGIDAGQFRVIPVDHHAPLIQARLVLAEGERGAAATAFAEWFDRQHDILDDFGYARPGENGCARR